MIVHCHVHKILKKMFKYVRSSDYFLHNCLHATIEVMRKLLTSNQKQALWKHFEAKPYLKPEEEHQLAQSFNISEECIKHWFSIRRYRTKKKGQLCEGEEFSVNHAIIDTFMYFGICTCNTKCTQA